MLHVSALLLECHDLGSFRELKEALRERARGEVFLRLDIKPPFPDTPHDWEQQLENVFSSVHERR